MNKKANGWIYFVTYFSEGITVLPPVSPSPSNMYRAGFLSCVIFVSASQILQQNQL